MSRNWDDIDIRTIENSYWWNSEKKQANILSALQGNRPQLTEITIQITDKCNKNCEKCNKTSFTNRDMDISLVNSIIDEASYMGLRHVHLTGGEPTQHKKLPEILRFCKEKNLRVDFSSNGFFERHRLIQFMDAGLGQINISYDFIDDTPDGLSYLGALRLDTFVNHMIIPSNYRQMPDFIRHIGENMGFVKDVQLMPPRGTARKFTIAEIKDYFDNYAGPSKKLAEKYGYDMLAGKADVVLGINENEWALASNGIYHSSIQTKCLRGLAEIRVGLKGYSPCTYLYRDGFTLCGLDKSLTEAFELSLAYCMTSAPPNPMCEKSCSPELANFNRNMDSMK